MATVRVGRLIVYAAAIEALTILALVPLVALGGPSEKLAAERMRKRSVWFGPAAGAVLCLVGGCFLARRSPSHSVLNGVLLGVAVAAIDIALLSASGTPFKPVFAVSNLLRVLAASTVGWLASRAANS